MDTLELISPFNPEELIVGLWPSPSEIRVSEEEKDSYFAGLREFYDSHNELVADIEERDIAIQRYTYPGVKEGKWGQYGLFPPVVVQFVLFLGTSGLAVILYKALDLWVKKVNGRRIRIKVGNIEIEATQLTIKQFEKLLQKIRECQKQFGELEIEPSKIKGMFSDYQIVDPDVLEKERNRLEGQFWNTRHKLQEKLGDKLNKE